MRASIIFLLFAAAFAQSGRVTFASIERITADRCQVVSDNAATICRSSSVQSSTLILPSAVSRALNPAFQAGSQTVTLTGNNLEAVTRFYLNPAGSTECDLADATQATVIAPFVSRTSNQIVFTLPTSANTAADATTWNAVALQIAGTPLPLCAATATGQVFTGVFVTAELSCATAADCGNQLEAALTPLPQLFDVLDATTRAVLRSRTQCCLQRQALGVGVCYNPAASTCCSDNLNAGSVAQVNEQCCNAVTGSVAPFGGRCPCNGALGDAACPSGERCCLPTKFAEFSRLSVFQTFEGECYNPGRERCCDTGSVFDPGNQQCCVINGLQSLNTPCPCGNDTDCYGGQLEFKNYAGACCRQTDPTPLESDLANGGGCSPYVNFPTGTGAATAQRCTGTCIDARYQRCCNGVTCVAEYEKCCNNTCCNNFVGSCERGLRPGAIGNVFNNNNFRVEFLTCSTVEHLTPIRTFFIFVMPAALVLSSLFGLAMVLIFANKASNRSYTPVEMAMILVASLILVLSLFLFFSPTWKYGILFVLAALIVILSAAARIWWLNFWAVVIVIVAILYYVDPFPGNDVLNFTSYRNEFVEGGPLLTYAAGFNWVMDMATRVNGEWCTDFYDYFRLDPNLLDTTRFHNPAVGTFGYCERDWLFAIMIIGICILVLLAVLLFLTLIALLLRFVKVAPAPVELVIEPGY